MTDTDLVRAIIECNNNGYVIEKIVKLLTNLQKIEVERILSTPCGLFDESINLKGFMFKCITGEAQTADKKKAMIETINTGNISSILDGVINMCRCIDTLSKYEEELEQQLEYKAILVYCEQMLGMDVDRLYEFTHNENTYSFRLNTDDSSDFVCITLD